MKPEVFAKVPESSAEVATVIEGLRISVSQLFMNEQSNNEAKQPINTIFEAIKAPEPIIAPEAQKVPMPPPQAFGQKNLGSQENPLGTGNRHQKYGEFRLFKDQQVPAPKVLKVNRNGYMSGNWFYI